MKEYLNNDIGLDWDDVIENDGKEFIVLKEGDYNFTITDFERSRTKESDKMKACNKAVLTLRVDSDKGTAFVHTQIVLNRMFEYKISSFFRSINRKRQGERVSMDWNNLVGERGRARFKIRNFKDKKTGEDRQANDVDRYIDYDPKYFEDEDTFDSIPDDDDLPFD